MGDTSAPDALPAGARKPLNFGRIIIVGGGCYGGYYVRQLTRAHLAGAATWSELIVVDRNPQCAVAALSASERPPYLKVAIAEWDAYFDRYLSDASRAADDHVNDAIVPSPLMPHLMAQWIEQRVRRRWPGRDVAVAPLERTPAIPWQRAGADGTHYVSFAEWMCPINCVEPEKCPATRGPRTWSMPPALATFAEQERAEGRAMDGPFVFHCTHRTYGVGMIDVREVLAADAAISRDAQGRAANILIGTASHCHGALQRLVLGAPVRERNSSPVDSL